MLDYLCGKKLLKILNPNIKVYPLYYHIEMIAFEKLKIYTQENNILSFLYKIPEFKELNCLTPKEEEVHQQKRTLNELLKDKSFLTKFCRSYQEIAFIESREISCSARRDNNI